ncbi:hypothetical protein CDEST_15285 [Colletotrichum destructivum]|uniref:Uncharacterized protein n=1 Tax=Colletotrichum destructivum TaxID=34406 RepID=A0AAX4J467_9PEZI|nr:hypothetical protein CDEST_15285 [Colletotrichum destructivum]
METVLNIQFTKTGNMPPDFGITAHPCWPKTLFDDPSFALLKDDPWYKQGNNRDNFIHWSYTKPRGTGNNNSNNNNPPSDDGSDTNMPDPSNDKDDDPSFPGRRALDELDNGNRSPGDLVILKGNSTRRSTSKELFEDLGLLRCKDQHCQRGIEELGYASLPVVRETATLPAMAEAVATASITNSCPEITIEIPASLSPALEIAAKVSDAARSIITHAPRHNPTM